jgi:Domain of unknown function (DUF4126)
MDFGLIAGTGWAAGLNVYAVALILGLIGRFGGAPMPEELTSTPVLIGAGVLYAVEFVADKVPYLDNIWDAVHTIIRPAAAGIIGYLLAGETGMSQALGAGAAGAFALAAHSTKATTRAAVNVSPEPMSNISLSIFEDGLVAGMVALAVAAPVVALIVVILFVILGAALVITLWRSFTRLWRRVGEWTAAPGA